MSFSSENRTTRKESQLAGAAKRPAGKGAEADDDDALSSAEVAAYLAEMIGELAVMARARRLDNVAYLLELARIEAALAGHRDD